MLGVPGFSAFQWTYDNWGSNPSATIGTSITPGASNVEGSWTQIASSANIAEDVYAIYMQIHTGSVASSQKDQLFDIGVDPAGGTSYTAIISDIDCGESPSLTAPGGREFAFPFFIKAGSSVAIRCQGNNATAGTVRAAVRFYGKPTRPENFPVGTHSETIGTISGSAGQSFTPGNAADGSWTDLGTTVRDLWWWQIGYGISNGTITAEYTYIELAWGDASNKHTIMKIMHSGTTNETCGAATQTNLLMWAAYQPVPAGSHIYVRGRTNNAPDTGYHAVAIGIGG